MHELTSKFLSAFNRLERTLKDSVRANGHVPFGQLVEQAAASNSAVRGVKKRLKRLGNIRNLFVHEHDHEEEAAIPTQGTVEALLALAKLIESPPTLLSLASKEVRWCRDDGPIVAAAKVMYDGQFSQLPVYESERLVGLLTGETVARWFAASAGDGQVVRAEEPIRAVLSHQEPTTSYAVLDQQATVFDGLEQFEGSLHRGQTLQAILVTPTGSETELPLGIVTPTDIPALLRASRG
jgi:predicted transcriptional regulator